MNDRRGSLTLTYKLVALDMDGTLLNEENRISRENADWIAKAIDSGVTVMMSTGRGIQNIRAYTDELGLNTPIVAANGAEVWKSPNEIHTRSLLQPATVKRLIHAARDRKVWYWTYSTEGLMSKNNWTEPVWEERDWLKVGYASEDPDKLNALRSWLEQFEDIEVTSSNETNLELSPAGVTKASGLEQVCQLLGIGMEQTVAVGDSRNDLSMIRAAGLGVAMGNASEEVKQAARRITGSNAEHGVAQLLQYVLECNDRDRRFFVPPQT